MDWSYLDEMDKNLLYMYAAMLVKRGNHQLYIPSDTGNEERNDMLDAEAKRKSAFYIIWFVYRYVLGCETLEQAEKYADVETLKRYRLTSLFEHNKRRIYIGAYGLNEIYLYNYKGGDLNIVLEIIYKRYDYFEQLECFLRRTEGTARTLRFRCMEAMEQSAEMMKGNARYKEILSRYEERRNGGNG